MGPALAANMACKILPSTSAILDADGENIIQLREMRCEFYHTAKKIPAVVP
jgi:hypothetical protein